MADDDGRIYASIYGSPENLRLAQLFACALDLLTAIEQLLAEADDPSMAAREAAANALAKAKGKGSTMSAFKFNQLVAIFDGDTDTGARGYVSGQLVKGEAPTGELVINIKEPGSTSMTGCVILPASRLRPAGHTNGGRQAKKTEPSPPQDFAPLDKALKKLKGET